MTIWKYELAITDRQEIIMPYGARVLSVANQGGNLCVWAMVDPTHDRRPLGFRIVGTGHPCGVSLGTFIGTVVIDPFVWHVFQE